MRLKEKLGASLIAITSVFGAAGALHPLEAQAQEQTARSFDIPPGGLTRALQAFAEQSDRNVLFTPDMVAGRTSPGVQGQMTERQALEALLAGTGLRSEQTASNGYAVRDPSSPTRLGDATSAEPSDAEEIVVVGTNIRGVQNPTAPVTVLDREYIDSSGITTTTRLIESLPQNFALANQSGTALNPPGLATPREQGSSINLRGIGEGTTLVLLNGRRLALGAQGSAVDISALPLSAIERVEVMTDGASAIYGSDAVGGVVNFVLRQDFDGTETRVRYGHADGVDEYRASQAFGRDWGSGNVIVSGEYYYRDMLKAADRDFVPNNVIIGSLQPENENHSLMVSGRQSLSPSLEAFADVLYVSQSSANRGGRFNATFSESGTVDSVQVSATTGLNWDVNDNWRVQVALSYGQNQVDGFFAVTPNPATFSLQDGLYRIYSTELKADGSLFELPGGSVQAAFGVGWREEGYDLVTVNGLGAFIGGHHQDRTVESAFGELLIPIVGGPKSAPGIRSLELSIAGRYDEYSSFGSSFDPRIGIAWELLEGLRFRAGYGTSYLAPKLTDFTNISLGLAGTVPVPGPPGSTAYVFIANGTASEDLGPQESENLSIGLEYRPDVAPGLGFGLNYYEVIYDGQIATPAQSYFVALSDPAAFGSIIFNNPTLAFVNDIVAQMGRGVTPIGGPFDPSAVDVVIDLRRRNLSVVENRGLDMSAHYRFDLATGEAHLGLDATLILDRSQQLTTTSTPFETSDTIYNPADLRLRSSLGWNSGGWAINTFVNYMDAYDDNRTTPSVEIDPWVAVDARVSYEFSNGGLGGLTLALSAQNLFDEPPPAVRVLNPLNSELGFDPTNANPMGRLIAIELTTRW